MTLYACDAAVAHGCMKLVQVGKSPPPGVPKLRVLAYILRALDVVATDIFGAHPVQNVWYKVVSRGVPGDTSGNFGTKVLIVI